MNKTQYSCGCGYKCSTLAEAVYHSDTTGHTLTVSGMITCDNRKKKIRKPDTRPYYYGKED